MRFLLISALLGLTASASTVTGFLDYFAGSSNPISSMSFTNGTYTITSSSLSDAYTFPPSCPFSGTPCSYDPSGGRNLSFGTPGGHIDWTIRDSTGTQVNSVGLVILLNYSYSGTPFLVQPTPGAPGNADTYSTSNVPLFFQGSIDMRQNGTCLWCESFAGSALSSSSYRGGPTGGANRTVTFTAATTPEPGTWALVGLGGLAAAAARKRRKS